ncbi:hypothetical protein GCM10011374_01820 [Kocuria dechangensis]|uniref:TIGR03089 family protein n=1 Tax=Kocuria dechangensis TaxID=1176249 RepID=A0A917LLW6_9MICC|nr:TIGR03089 family protein [Kocuria dechangensis]GGG43065.1 hypothetical protein GCM10011374_01820 [Kocuria dechangensis]
MNFPLPTSVPRLVDTLRRSSRPALLWYGADGERVELSGRVLDNWAAKTANLCVDELDLGSGDLVVLGDEVHWRALAVTLGAWTAGAAVRPSDPRGTTADGDVVVALVDAEGGLPPLLAHPPAGARAVVVDRPALSLGLRGGAPDDAVDYCAEVRSHADVYSGLEEPVADGPALPDPDVGQEITHARLLPRALEEAAGREEQWGTAAAVHVPGRQVDPRFLLRVLAVLASGRAVVLTDRDTADGSWTAVLTAENAVGF